MASFLMFALFPYVLVDEESWTLVHVTETPEKIIPE